ncbi:hypothetical protein CC80DRAFT_598762 [Byssothecium circinans]|uniref:Uncharacterized protein n=1 Tax=Byssothecium circinans TaxID=147558 RepID=A0A6A5T9E2_9PLEO|nr:hypothetical protein CC80DRAFT_598762 [Byssothecium circinans]
MVIAIIRAALGSAFKRQTNSTPKAPPPPTVEWLLAHREQRLGSSTTQTDWAVASIPDPKDADPARYAILAVIPQFMVAAFNRLIERGLPRGSPAIIMEDEAEEELKSSPVVLEELPSLAANVPKLAETLIIPDADGSPLDEQNCSPQFLGMDIVGRQPHTLFV